MAISKVCVIGAGVMGSGIAAQVANADVPVLLLDIVPAGAADRNLLAKAALERLQKTEPAPLMSKAAAKLIAIGNIEDDLAQLKNCDWIIEAITEKVEAKQALYKKIDAARKKGAVLSSNTSTIPLKMLMAGMPAGITQDFCITHFFNPPRYMRLLEVVAGPHTRADAIAAVSEFADVKLGKAVVKAKDTPGFIANRIGVFWIQCAVNTARELGLTVEEADAVMGRPIGAPKSGVFDLLDVVGLDLQPHIDASLRIALPKSDAYVQMPADFPLMKKMIAEGSTGRKGKGGFYRLIREGGKKEKQVIDLKTGEYRAMRKAALESVDAAKGGLKALVSHPDRGGTFAWTVLSRTLSYAAALVPDIADTISDVDLAMRTGFNWKRGPFQLIDQLGATWFAEKLAADKMSVPALVSEAAKQGGFYKGGDQLSLGGGFKPVPRPAGSLLLSDIKAKTQPLAKNSSTSVWDIGDGVACLEFHSKMNTIDPDTLSIALKAIEIVGKGMKALVIHNEADNFSVGANLGLALFAANVGVWPMIEDLLTQGQAVMKAIKFAPFPVVAAPTGLALGGGTEFLLHCAAVQAHAELYMGLVEVGVGIIPGWGGCKEMLIRKQPGTHEPKGPMPAVMAAFEQISLAKVSRSAADAKELRYLRKSDAITMNRDRLLADAKALALKLADNYKPPQATELRLPGVTGFAALQMAIQSYAQQGLALPHDVTVAMHLAKVLSGGATDITEVVSEDRVMELERQEFMTLVKTEPTLSRMEVMLATGKPLRN
jgi:3-hydroxyacyl-CoA dehydrogenase